MTHHELHGHEPVNLANHQKHRKTQAVSGKLILQAYEGISEVPLEKPEDNAEPNSTNQCRRRIKAQRMPGLPATTKTNKEVDYQVLKEKYHYGNDEKVKIFHSDDGLDLQL